MIKKAFRFGLYAAFILAVLMTAAGCASLRFSYTEKSRAEKLSMYRPQYPETQFAVISDPHLYDKKLGTDGEAFEEYLQNDRKLLVESEELLTQAVEMIIADNPEFMIIAGDLTKDGELVNHALMASYLGKLEEAGIATYIVPGNHDILNPHAHAFTPEGEKQVDTVTPDDFVSIYAASGYDEAIDRDPSSLSYVAEPVEGLWILALDSAHYDTNFEDDYPYTDGEFTQQRIDWIESTLEKAVDRNKAVIAVMHHGIMEHYDSQEKHFGDYIVDDYEKISDMFAAYKVRLVFTGHYHAQDIVKKETDSNTFVFDIETGSLVTYPCPVRFLSFDGENSVSIESVTIDDLPSYSEKGADFRAHAKEYVYNGIYGIAVDTMLGLNMKREESEGIAGYISDAFIAHYQGDENFTGEVMLPTEGLSFMGRLVIGNRKSLVYGLWDDKEPADNNITIDLNTGEWSEK